MARRNSAPKPSSVSGRSSRYGRYAIVATGPNSRRGAGLTRLSMCARCLWIRPIASTRDAHATRSSTSWGTICGRVFGPVIDAPGQGSPVPSSMLRVREVGSAPGVPLAALVAEGGYAAGALQHRGDVHEVERHERRVAVGEVVLRAARAGVEVGRARADRPYPPCVGLGRDGVTEVLEAVEHVHRAVLDAVLVPRDQAPGCPAVVGVLTMLVE